MSWILELLTGRDHLCFWHRSVTGMSVDVMGGSVVEYICDRCDREWVTLDG